MYFNDIKYLILAYFGTSFEYFKSDFTNTIITYLNRSSVVFQRNLNVLKIELPYLN